MQAPSRPGQHYPDPISDAISDRHQTHSQVQPQSSPDLWVIRSLENLGRWMAPPSRFARAFGDAIAWLAGAIGLRLIVDYGLALMPSLWLVAALVLIMPALLTAGLATLVPPMSLVFGYRSLLLMFGLLLGGQL
jgi:hypothetical protein